MSFTDTVVQEWARTQVTVPEGGRVSLDDGRITSGGCETCGYGGDEAYFLELWVYDANGKWVDTVTYGDTFSGLMRDLIDISERLRAKNEEAKF